MELFALIWLFALVAAALSGQPSAVGLVFVAPLLLGLAALLLFVAVVVAGFIFGVPIMLLFSQFG